ncbi:MAG: hypothetical protein AB1744_09205 [Candidatus Zixiibacteriota bacterium]
MQRILFRLLAGLFFLCLNIGCDGDDNGAEPPGLPAKIVAINGLYYKADSLAQKPLTFAVADRNNNYLPDQQIQLIPLEGDGTLSHRSIVTDSTGTATFGYGFTGSLGHAIVRLIAPNVDTMDVSVRRNILIPGPGGQTQYVLFDDTYADVKKWNGLPASVDVFNGSEIIYVNYESVLGVVVMTYDLDTGGVIFDTSSIYGAIVNTVYGGKTAEGIGVWSTIDTVRAVYGQPDSIWYDPRPPAAIAIEYDSLGLTFYGRIPDTVIFEIHLAEVPLQVPVPPRTYTRRISNPIHQLEP